MDKYIKLLAKEEQLKDIQEQIRTKYIKLLTQAACHNINTIQAADEEEKKKEDREFYASMYAAQQLIELMGYSNLWEDYNTIYKAMEYR